MRWMWPSECLVWGCSVVPGSHAEAPWHSCLSASANHFHLQEQAGLLSQGLLSSTAGRWWPCFPSGAGWVVVMRAFHSFMAHSFGEGCGHVLQEETGPMVKFRLPLANPGKPCRVPPWPGRSREHSGPPSLARPPGGTWHPGK